MHDSYAFSNLSSASDNPRFFNRRGPEQMNILAQAQISNEGHPSTRNVIVTQPGTNFVMTSLFYYILLSFGVRSDALHLHPVVRPQTAVTPHFLKGMLTPNAAIAVNAHRVDNIGVCSCKFYQHCYTNSCGLSVWVWITCVSMLVLAIAGVMRNEATQQNMVGSLENASLPKTPRPSLVGRGSVQASVDSSGVHEDEAIWRSRVYIDVVGAFFFMAGSPFFIYQSLTTSCLFYYRVGTGLWIPGCVAYMIAPSSDFHEASLSGKLSDSLQIGGLLCYIIGCSLPFDGTEERVISWLPTINLLFLTAGILLTIDTAKTCTAACVDPASGFTSANSYDVCIALSFLLAAILGGYGQNTTEILVGLYMWAVGSCVCLLRASQGLASYRSSKEEVRASSLAGPIATR